MKPCARAPRAPPPRSARSAGRGPCRCSRARSAASRNGSCGTRPDCRRGSARRRCARSGCRRSRCARTAARRSAAAATAACDLPLPVWPTMPTKLPAGIVERDVVQHRLRGVVAEAHVGELDAARADRGARCATAAPRGSLQQRIDARRGDHRLLQQRELHRDLDQRLDDARDVRDERVQQADFHALQLSACRPPPRCATISRMLTKSSAGPQQPRVGAHLADARRVVRVVGAREARGEAARPRRRPAARSCRRCLRPSAR